MIKDSVLIIDDNQMTSNILKALLEESGFSTDTCEDGDRALHIAMNGRHNIFLIDYRMPRMTGDEVTAMLRTLRPDAFIIGFSIEAKEHVFLDAGANLFLNKTSLLTNLIPAIQNRGTF